MGFGILFIGYLLTYLLSMAGGYGCYPAIVGCVVMLYALTKLTEYEPRFKYAFFCVIPVALCVAFTLVSEVTAMAGASLPGFLGWGATAYVIGYVKAAADMLFHTALLLAITKIAGDTGVVRTQKAALRNLIIYTVFFIVSITGSVMPEKTTAALYLFLAQLILWLSWMVLDSICIFSCYMRICDENDGDMAAKPSRFKTINRLRAEFDRREAKAQQSSREYHTEKMKKRIDRINSGNKKKNKKK